ncbi:MAG: asparagine synthase (glutamine-hydrolyzing) [Bacteroidetes bacterium]|nr:MAG: asparagine synthase (glutamine-hydrolyzing) [Bacteroidota bacterium]REK33676.1 MAG: asparagine synthase (glutamine-hydrolyzing) [Bacteroidota bacterium]REK47247.1 MAG: asparagine synthase (glutamine-hydrolyzing) [Bacteroidota bacterium]
MCGVAGYISFSHSNSEKERLLRIAVSCLARRGPDNSGYYNDRNVFLGHARLSVIDISDAASQPMTDPSGRYTIIFNGEFFNFKEHREYLLSKGISLITQSDTEVLLHLYILEKEKCLERINGFFAFAIYDNSEQEIFIARDRIGVKPLLYSLDAGKFIFASEMKAMMAMGIEKKIDNSSILTYLQLNYIPAPHSIFENVKKLMPGHFIKFSTKGSVPDINPVRYYQIEVREEKRDYADACSRLKNLLEASVNRRMISDVPLGAFLSGGLDSSIITGIAASMTDKLRTFSIGFRDEPRYDESHYAEIVAKKFRTEHQTFMLKNDDLFSNLFEALDYIDEPFADSSALNVYILSKETRKHVTVALSGDGADELFGGYNKHAAELRARSGGVLNQLLRSSSVLLQHMPQDRSSGSGDIFRKLTRMSIGLKLSPAERYWRWASFESEENAGHFLAPDYYSESSRDESNKRKEAQLKNLKEPHSMQQVLLTDMQLVLVNDMLVKTDLMSMANSLEIRNPFLDYTLVDYAFSLPLEYKIRHGERKKILRDAYRDFLPDEITRRSKRGFEVPLLKWQRNELNALLRNELLEKNFIETQGVFNFPAIEKLLNRLHSKSPGDAPAQIWALMVFQYWWRKHIA